MLKAQNIKNPDDFLVSQAMYSQVRQMSSFSISAI